MSGRTIAELPRTLGVWGLVATGVSTMVGGAINVLPLMLHRSTPAIGPYVPLAYFLAAVPAVFAALAYARLASAMPRAGGSYVYVSRVLHPSVGFVASFCQWFGLSVITGVVAYLIVPFLRDFVAVVAPQTAQSMLANQWVTLGVPVGALWLFAWINLQGSRAYELTVIPLMLVMFACSSIVIGAGIFFDHADFVRAASVEIPQLVYVRAGLDWRAIGAGTAILFGSFIGFETIALAGGEARDPRRTLPLAILVAIGGVALFYFAFCLAVYHVVPWQFASDEAQVREITVPGMLSFVLGKPWAAVVTAGAAIALLNHLPAMILAVSRMLYAWSVDGLLPRAFSRLDPHRGAPQVAILASTAVATASVLACHYAGDFFLGIDVLTTTMLVNFALVCISLLVLLLGNPRRAASLGLVQRTRWEAALPGTGLVLLLGLLGFHVRKDLTAAVDAWYLRSTWLLILVLAAACVAYILRRKSVSADARR